MTLIELLFLITSFLICISIHEFSHAYAAFLLGDPTAKNHGRMTLNPFKHLDFFGTFLIIIAHFGWGKPVPVNPKYFKNPKRDTLLVALAGPLSNLLLAIIGITLLKHFIDPKYVIFDFFHIFVSLNIILAVFNLLPFPPLDGSKIIDFFVPITLESIWRIIKIYSPFILFFILLIESSFKVEILSSIIKSLTDIIFAWFYLIS